jgi:hypothetical protein
MTKSPDPWMSMDECIAHVMRVEGCSRRAARRLIAKHMAAGDLPYKIGPEKVKGMEYLDSKTAVKMMKERPDEVLIGLDQLKKAYHYTTDELLAELSSGRLVAGTTNESVAVAMDLAQRGDHSIPLYVSDFVVTAVALIEWINNPETPRDIVEKYFRKVQ